MPALLLDRRFWETLTGLTSPACAKFILDNKGKSKAKFIDPNPLIDLPSGDIGRGVVSYQLIKEENKVSGSLDFAFERLAPYSFEIEENCCLALIRMGHLSASVKYCGRQLFKEDQASSRIATVNHGFVYFIRNGDLYKIGITENLLRRVKELNPDEILNVVRCSNYKELERKLHEHFKHKRLPQTEYFRLDPHQVDEVYMLMTKMARYEESPSAST